MLKKDNTEIYVDSMLLRNSFLHAWTSKNHRERSGNNFVLQHKQKQTISLVRFCWKRCVLKRVNNPAL